MATPGTFVQFQCRIEKLALLAQFKSKIENRYSLMIGELRKMGLLSADEAIDLAKPRLNLAVDNRRNPPSKD